LHEKTMAMTRQQMLDALDDLHGLMVFEVNYRTDRAGARPQVTFTDEHMQALRQGVLELKGREVRREPVSDQR